ncbi:MAG: NAD-dependent epimerase/dehydratase family protein [Chloroflexi bacterium]|nr:MAG: NAD-dependent epimerase/dehydratase family protein [Chloroflexota bacterium]MBL1195049.1 SDR family oxidoreductase [Chloroflexota bacterium]NOH12337.1 SDR family oxidoreductase [Chloroflexota bacterium]
MKVAVFGATGGTGRLIVEQALGKQYRVSAFVRNPKKLSLKNEELLIVQGDIQDPEKVSSTISGVDAVISTLGPTDNKSQFVVSTGLKNILAGMKQHSISRLVVSFGVGVGDPNDAPTLVDKFVNAVSKSISRNKYQDIMKAVKIVRESDVDWTIVRVPMLTDEPRTDDVKVAWVGKGLGMRLSRADFAAFMLDQIVDNTYLHKSPAISNVDMDVHFGSLH